MTEQELLSIEQREKTSNVEQEGMIDNLLAEVEYQKECVRCARKMAAAEASKRTQYIGGKVS